MAEGHFNKKAPLYLIKRAEVFKEKYADLFQIATEGVFDIPASLGRWVLENALEVATHPEEPQFLVAKDYNHEQLTPERVIEELQKLKDYLHKNVISNSYYTDQQHRAVLEKREDADVVLGKIIAGFKDDYAPLQKDIDSLARTANKVKMAAMKKIAILETELNAAHAINEENHRAYFIDLRLREAEERVAKKIADMAHNKHEAEKRNTPPKKREHKPTRHTARFISTSRTDDSILINWSKRIRDEPDDIHELG